MMRRRGLLGAFLAAPIIVRTPGLLMPISPFILPHLILRTYGYDSLGKQKLLDTIRMDDFDFSRGSSRGYHTVKTSMQVWRATVETVGHSRLFDGREIPVDFNGPRAYAPGQDIGLNNLRFHIS